MVEAGKLMCYLQVSACRPVRLARYPPNVERTVNLLSMSTQIKKGFCIIASAWLVEEM